MPCGQKDPSHGHARPRGCENEGRGDYKVPATTHGPIKKCPEPRRPVSFSISIELSMLATCSGGERPHGSCLACEQSSNRRIVAKLWRRVPRGDLKPESSDWLYNKQATRMAAVSCSRSGSLVEKGPVMKPRRARPAGKRTLRRRRRLPSHHSRPKREPARCGLTPPKKRPARRVRIKALEAVSQDPDEKNAASDQTSVYTSQRHDLSR